MREKKKENVKRKTCKTQTPDSVESKRPHSVRLDTVYFAEN